MMALTLLELTFMLCYDSRKPNNFFVITRNIHLRKLRLT